jgi:hypothetical protein
MKNSTPRSFNCKNEELPVVCGFLAISLTRDLSDFTTYSPVFDQAYVDGFKAKTEAVQELVQPKSETLELKLITDNLYGTLDRLISPINYLEGYISLAGKKIPISAADFGLVQLRKSARSRDVENVLTSLHTVTSNINKYKPVLTEKGLSAELINQFSDATISLSEAKKKKYKLVSNRAALVQNNMGLLNELNDHLVEICDIGKILYKQTDKAKLKDYTFTQMMKQVRRNVKPEEQKPTDTTSPESNE